MEDSSEKELLILGNGFDLSCGLKSSYIDFFDYRFDELFFNTEGPLGINLSQPVSSKDTKKSKFDLIREYIENNYVDYRSQNIDFNIGVLDKFDRIKIGTNFITRWDVLFLYAEKYISSTSEFQWQDVENMILFIISIVCGDDSLNSKFKTETDYELISFIKVIENCTTNFDDNSKETRLNLLLDDLIKFELVFGRYIFKQIDGNDDYQESLLNLLNLIIDNSDLSVITFNYSLDILLVKKIIENRQHNFNLKSWFNVHGMARVDDLTIFRELMKMFSIKNDIAFSRPIFGVSNEFISSGDPREIFTKDYRLLGNRTDAVNTLDLNVKYNSIKIYGHSLGMADYKYFETIFDSVDLLNSKTEITFYYYIQYNMRDYKVDSRLKRTAINAINQLFDRYGRHLSNTTTINVMNKLIMENRIHFIPNPKEVEFRAEYQI